jgi:hypothetical protein
MHGAYTASAPQGLYADPVIHRVGDHSYYTSVVMRIDKYLDVRMKNYSQTALIFPMWSSALIASDLYSSRVDLLMYSLSADARQFSFVQAAAHHYCTSGNTCV